MVEIQPQQQQDANANATVPGYEVQTITMDMGPDSTTTTEDRDMGYSGEDLFLEEKKVSFVADWIGPRGMRNSKKKAKGHSVQQSVTRKTLLDGQGKSRLITVLIYYATKADERYYK